MVKKILAWLLTCNNTVPGNSSVDPTGKHQPRKMKKYRRKLEFQKG